MNENEIRKIGPVYNEVNPNNANIKLILTTIQIKNLSTKQVKLEVYPFVLESSGFSNGINLDLYNVLNGDNATVSPVLKPGEVQTLELPFTMIESQFTKQDWLNLTNRNFELVLSLYPIKKSILLN